MSESMKNTIFLTGATGFLGSYVTDRLLADTTHELAMLTRADSREAGIDKLWRAMQLHMDAHTFRGYLDRVRFIPGDLTAPGLGLALRDRHYLVEHAESVLHIAASLNRKSEKACLNQNLRGTLAVVQLARAMHDDHGLRRFSHVSTVAVAGARDSEHVFEDDAIDWDRSDYDPYGRTKKFCEHMVRELLPDVPKTFFRPSTVMGDSRCPDTTQFDMVRAFCVLADLPLLPLRGDGRMDIVNADWVGRAVATLHMAAAPSAEIYHLSAGEDSPTLHEIAGAIARHKGKRPPVFLPALGGPFARTMSALSNLRRRSLPQLVGSLFTVFLPYITYDTVFDNRRAVEALGVRPVRFTEYCAELYDYAKRVGYRYPAEPLPPVFDAASGAASLPAAGDERSA